MMTLQRACILDSVSHEERLTRSCVVDGGGSFLLSPSLSCDTLDLPNLAVTATWLSLVQMREAIYVIRVKKRAEILSLPSLAILLFVIVDACSANERSKRGLVRFRYCFEWMLQG